MRRWCAATVAVLSGVLPAGCTPATRTGTGAVIEVDAPVALADRPLHIRIGRLAPHERITVASESTARDGVVWHGRATLTADARGMVDLATSRPASGSTYAAVDGMGLFWSMRPPSGDPDAVTFAPEAPPSAVSYQVRIAVTAHGRLLAGRTLTRRWLAPGVTARALTLARNGLVGELFLPPPGAVRHPAVLTAGGSEGGNTLVFAAALLASHGYPALALGYFGLPGLPATLHDIPLEYFARAARLLATQPGADPAHLIAMGYSRGSEAALLLGADYPDLVHGAVVYSPSAQVDPGFPPPGVAWTWHGRAIDQDLIPVSRIGGPVLAIAGGDDLVWGSAEAVAVIGGELALAHDRYPHPALVYPLAGHLVGTFPFLPTATRHTYPDGTVVLAGGSRAADAAAREQGWPQVLAFLATQG